MFIGHKFCVYVTTGIFYLNCMQTGRFRIYHMVQVMNHSNYAVSMTLFGTIGFGAIVLITSDITYVQWQKVLPENL